MIRYIPSRFVILLLLLLISAAIKAQTIEVQPLTKPLIVDGLNDDWPDIPTIKINLRKTNSNNYQHVTHVLLKSGIYGGSIYFFIEWDDDSYNNIHKPWVWDSQQSKYTKGPQREDRLAIQFGMEGDYTNDWLSGKSFKADTWHWKASRSNPIGLVHDKSTIISSRKILRSAKFKSRDGNDVYIARPSDAGDKLYKTKRYRKYVDNIMPKYILAQNPQGSVADIKGKGIWKNGRWSLEIQRKLNTHHDDDVRFPADGGTVIGAIAVFNASDNEDHSISDILSFEF